MAEPEQYCRICCRRVNNSSIRIIGLDQLMNFQGVSFIASANLIKAPFLFPWSN